MSSQSYTILGPHSSQAGLEVLPSNEKHFHDHSTLESNQGNAPNGSAYPHEYGQHGYSSPATERRILGLKPKIFWITVIALVVTLAAAIGGGVGGGLASQKKSNVSSQPQSTSPTSTSRSTNPSSTSTSSLSSTSTASTPLFSSGCNETDNTSYTPSNAATTKPYSINGTVLTYTIHCYTNLPDSSSGANSQIHKLEKLLHQSSLEDCITACAMYNDALNTASSGPELASLCSGVVYYLSNGVSSCDLNSGVTDDAERIEFAGEVDSAILQWQS